MPLDIVISRYFETNIVCFATVLLIVRFISDEYTLREKLYLDFMCSKLI